MNPPPSGAPSLRLYSTAARALVPVELDADRAVRMYTCGPTVYRSVHLGNLRSYLLADSIRRVLLALGRDVRHVKNITDVGHMRQELLDRGEDKVVAEALRAGVTSLEIAQRFTDEFLYDEQRIRILPAHVFPRATEHVERMIAITEALVASGFAYEREGNVYFRVAQFAGYGELGGSLSREGLRQGVRTEADPHKDDPRDFALWKGAEPERTELVWPSPWGRGFPGWHIECTAMSTQHLGPQVDIHTGGVDNIFPHHEDERAQSEAFTGVRPFARIWVHGQHLLADGLKMAKSTGNAYTLSDLEGLEFEPLAFRYLCLTTHYRSRLNFTFTSLRAAQTGLRRLRAHVAHWGAPSALDALGPEARACRERFWALAADDLSLPRCLALVWSLARGAARSVPPDQKAALARDFDRLLGLDLGTPPGHRPADPFRGAVSSTRAFAPVRVAFAARSRAPAVGAARRALGPAGAATANDGQASPPVQGTTPSGQAPGAGRAANAKQSTSQPPATASAPAASDSPAANAKQSTSQPPATASAPAASDSPAANAKQSTSQPPATASAPAASNSPAANAEQSTSQPPATASAPAASDSLAANAKQSTSQPPATASAPAASDSPAANAKQSTSQPPATASAPAASNSPAAIAEQSTSQPPATASAPAASDSPAAAEARALSLVVVVQPDEDLAAVERCLRGVLRFHGQVDVEVVLVDATGSPQMHAELVQRTRALEVVQVDPNVTASRVEADGSTGAAPRDGGRLRLVWIDHDPGAAGARNLGLLAARGIFVGLLDPSIELTGDDALDRLLKVLDDPAVGAVGPFGLLTPDLRHFHELDAEPDPGQPREVDALQNYLLVFRRAHLERIGPLDEHYRFYRILDLDLSYTIRDRVGRLVTLGHLAVVRHRHALWEALSDGDREERSRKNFGRFLKRWDHRHDLDRHGDPARAEGPVAVHG